MREGSAKNSLRIRTLKHLCFLLGLDESTLRIICDHPDRYYHPFQKVIKGKLRDLVDVQEPLKMALKRLNKRMQSLDLPFYIHGGVRGRSPVTNALPHTGPRVTLFKADIKQFFPNIDIDKVRRTFGERLLCGKEEADCLARICTFNGVLPQGAPTSTIVAVFVAEHLSFRLHRLATEHHANFTQFVDDITISGPSHLVDLTRLVERIIEEEGFSCHPEKLSVLQPWTEHVITGVRVDQAKDAPSNAIRSLRSAIENLEQNDSNATDKVITSLHCKVRHVATLNPGTGRALGKRLTKTLKAQVPK